MKERSELATELIQYRQRNGLSQKDMAVVIGCHQNTYVLWERGVGRPNSDYMRKLNKMLKHKEVENG